MSAELDALRGQLSDLDAELLELVAERQRVVAAIGELKLREGLPTRDFSREREVLLAGRDQAGRLGVPQGLAEALLRLLIRSSLTHQEQAKVIAGRYGSGKRALVIGGGGKMGRWFVEFLSSQGFEVELADPAAGLPGHASHRDWRESALDHDVIVVATPLLVANRILLELARRRPAGLLFDIGSLKGPLRAGIEALAAAGCRVSSLHPMFGPDTELLSGRHVIFVDVGHGPALEQTRELFASTMAEHVTMTLEEHDRAIAYVLGLSHALNIAFFTALARSGETALALARLSSTTFDAQLDVAARVAEENPHLYFEIQSLNPYGAEVLEALQSAVEAVRKAVTGGDEAAFVELMQRGRAYLSGRSRGADPSPRLR